MAVVTAVIAVLREQVLALVLRLRTLASHDWLTGALNRGAFEQRVDAELARARRTTGVTGAASPPPPAGARAPRIGDLARRQRRGVRRGFSSGQCPCAARYSLASAS